MDKVFEFINVATLIFCCILSIFCTLFVRRPVDYLLKKINKKYFKKINYIWREYLLRIIPGIISIIFLLKTEYPFPEEIQSLSYKIIFGLFLGFCSNYIYSAFKAKLSKLKEK